MEEEKTEKTHWNPLEFLRYCLVGVFDTALEFALLYLLAIYLEIWYQAAALFSYLVGMVANFILSKSFSFRNTSKEVRKQLLMFFVIGGIGLAWNQFLLFVFHGNMGWDLMLSKAITLGFLVLWHYFMHRNITFGWYQ